MGEVEMRGDGLDMVQWRGWGSLWWKRGRIHNEGLKILSVFIEMLVCLSVRKLSRY